VGIRAECGVLAETRIALRTHELLKIKLPRGAGGARCTARTNLPRYRAEPVQLIGRVAIIYRPSDKPKIQLRPERGRIPKITRASPNALFARTAGWRCRATVRTPHDRGGSWLKNHQFLEFAHARRQPNSPITC